MSTCQGEGHGVSEDGHPIGHSLVPHVLQMYISPSSTRSSEAGHSHRLRSPIVPLVRSPGLRLYLSSSFARSVDTRIRNSPAVQAFPVNANTSADIATVRRSQNVMTHTSVDIAAASRSSNVITHTSANASGLPSKSRKRKLTSDIWDDFTPIYDDDGRLMQGQCIHCDAIFQTDKKFGSSHCVGID